MKQNSNTIINSERENIKKSLAFFAKSIKKSQNSDLVVTYAKDDLIYSVNAIGSKRIIGHAPKKIAITKRKYKL